MKKLVLLSFLLLTASITQQSYAWGKTGHNLVGKLAAYFLDDSTRAIVQQYLGNLSFEEAANWMDDSRSNSYYEYMRTWHYLDMDKGEEYKPTGEHNVLTVLHSAIVNLRDYKKLKKKEVKRDLLLIFHLVGDLHQPLHTGYTIDKGGNTIMVNSPSVSGNLHSVWDTQILEFKRIDMDSCLDYYKTMDSTLIAQALKINEYKWMKESRSYLDSVYSFQNNFLDQHYIDSNTQIIKKQLLLAGLRLAAILKDTFNKP